MAAVVSAPGKVGGVGYCLAAAALLGCFPCLPSPHVRGFNKSTHAFGSARARIAAGGK
jgi:hypothetical protein